MHKHSTLRFAAAFAIGLQVIGLAACQEEGGTAVEPTPREDVYWRKLHDSYVERAKKKDIDLLFLGDSITQGWSDNDVWKRHYEPRHAANFGIGGDRTGHVLWRLQNGTVDGLSPRVVVLMIGTNNIGANTPAEIAAGIRKIVQTLRNKMPKTKVLLLGVFPRGATRSKDLTEDKPDPRPAQINALISKLDDGEHVFYLDIGKAFLNDQGTIPKSLMPDFLHLNAEGYQRWADAIEPTLWKLMDDDRNVKQP